MQDNYVIRFKVHEEIIGDRQVLVLDELEATKNDQPVDRNDPDVVELLVLEQEGDRTLVAPMMLSSIDELMALGTVVPDGDWLLFATSVHREEERSLVPTGGSGRQITCLADLLDYFCVETITDLDKHLYDKTDRGVGIAVLTPDGQWYYDRSDWTGVSEITAFMIRASIENSDAVVESLPLVLPVGSDAIDGWVKDVDAEAKHLWEAANYDHFYLKSGSDYLATGKVTWDDGVDGVVFEDDYDDEVPIDKIRQAIADLLEEYAGSDRPLGTYTIEVDGVQYQLEEYEPETC